MIAFFSCLGALTLTTFVLYFAFVRPLQRKVDEMGRTFAASEARNKALHRMRKDEIARLKRLSGEEVEAISERLDEIETRKTTVA
jgi:hypothetical protein